MGFMFRKRVRFGPFIINGSNSGLSYTLKIGPWSWNSRAKAHRVDLPGPFSWKGKRRG